MMTLKQLAGLTLALSAASLSSLAQSKKSEPIKVLPPQERVEVRLDNRDILEGPAAFAQALDGYEKRMVVGQSEAVDQPLIISTGSLDENEVSNLEEDLTIMGRILEKSINRSGGGDESERKAMGIHLWTLGQGGRGARNLYIEGHGAIFVLNANMPLVGGKTVSDEKEKKEPAHSAWESTRDEIFGENDSEPRRVRRDRPGAVQFDAGRLDSLKKTLGESLKNASNIRGLKDNETVTIVVQGPTGRAYAVTANGNVRVRAQGQVDAFSFTQDPRRGGPRTLLTLRAKKGDIDDFSKGKTDADSFRKKLTISNYQSGGGKN